MTLNKPNRVPQGIAILTILLAYLAVSPALTAQEVAEIRSGPGGIEFAPTVEAGTLLLTVSGPEGYYQRATFGAAESSFLSLFDEAGNALPDGVYTYELTVGAAETVRREALDETQGLPGLSTKLNAPKHDVQSGTFAIQGGALVDSSPEEPGPAAGSEPQGNRLAEKQVISGDLTVYNSLCVGFDCATSETYGADTIRLKENNLRIHFDDTSTAGSYPRTDWRIEANSNLNGGGSYFRVTDASASRDIMTLEASAPSHSLYVENSGDVGFGTANPVLDLHATDGDTPALRLEQNTSSGFGAQTWDIAGNETSFFVRDATNGSTLPFRIRPGASSNSLVIDTDSDVGVGILSPSAPLHVVEGSGSEGSRTVLKLENNGVTKFDVQDTSADGSTWTFETEGPSFRVNKNGTGGEELIVRDRLDGLGNATLVVNGSVQATNVSFTSSRAAKTAFVPVDGRHVLRKVVSLPMAEWSFKDERNERRHIGPLAEDFNTMFDLGGSKGTISVIDTQGITIAAVQGLYREIQERDERIEELEVRIAMLEELFRKVSSQR